MEPQIDPATSLPLPADSIQRVLFVSSTVHVYNIPPLTSTKGYLAASWTTTPSRQIFTARLRIFETAIPIASTPSASSKSSSTPTDGDSDAGSRIKTDILLEDPASGALFAAAPYTSPSVVEQVLDSSRFFAITVRGEGGRKAVLGIGFEERSEAFDFSVALQEARRGLGWDGNSNPNSAPVGKGKKAAAATKVKEEKRDFGLKEGEMITVNIPGKSGRRERRDESNSNTFGEGNAAEFSLPPPPGGAGGGGSTGAAFGLLPPPPSAEELKKQKRRSQGFEDLDLEGLRRVGEGEGEGEEKSLQEMGFDDGEFGEFQ